MTQRKAEKTKSKSGRKKLTLRKETLRDLKARNPQAQKVKGGADCWYHDAGCWSSA